MIGSTLAHYRVTAKLGAGGMGEVYLARDTRLDRDVAIKILPPGFAKDPARVARFEREAKVLASLNDPGIAAIYGFEPGDTPFLALEYVPGETLAEIIARGPLALDEALRVASRIAEALEAAHERGVVHRDLKPPNIKITPERKVKVLDFGLAKALGEEPGGAPADVSQSPTKTEATHAGAILGTATYMSPEQARGNVVDRRTDIWAFGCVLYEMLTGRRVFDGRSVPDAVAAILRAEPDFNALPAGTPLSIRTLLRRCLAKDPARRLRDIADARLEIEEASIAEAAMPGKPERPARMTPWLLGGLAAAFAILAAWSIGRTPQQARRPQSRTIIALPPKTTMVLGRGASVALSPDGTRLVYVAASGGRTLLYQRPLDQFESTPLEGSEGAANPFFSPDGQWIGFFANRKLKKVSMLGGAPITICDAFNARGEAWGPDDTIFFTPQNNMGIWRVSASGGAPQEVTRPGKGELSHRWPQVLPGGKSLLYTVWNDTGFEPARIAVYSLETGQQRILLQGGGYARYVAGRNGAAYLVYARPEGLVAARFDPGRLELTGPPVPVLPSVVSNLSGGAHFSVSADGALVYLPGIMGEGERTVVWVDQKGNTELLAQIRGMSLFYRISPDGRRLARSNTEGPDRSIWIYDLERKASTRFTFGPNHSLPIWTPDGKRLIFNSGLPNAHLSWKAADGSGAEEQLTSGPNDQLPNSFSPDGKMLVYAEYTPSQGSDIWILPLDGDRKPRPFFATQFSEGNGAVSPDGRWLAYQSNESGQFEIYVQPFPAGGRKWQISSEGGVWPRWGKDGREIFFRDDNTMMSAAVVTAAAEFKTEAPRKLFEGRYDGVYDLSPDGRKFLMLKGAEQETAPTQLNLVLNWVDDLERRTTAAKK